MRLQLAVAVWAVLTAASASCEEAMTFKGSRFNPEDGWTQIAKGVFQRETDGSGVERVALGESGAAYDRQSLKERLEKLKSERDPYGDSHDIRLDQEIRSIEEAIERAGSKADGLVTQIAQTGGMCNNTIGYQFDSILNVGASSTSLTGKSTLLADNFGPPYPGPTSATFGVVLEIDPAIGAPVTTAASSNLSNTPINPDGSQTLSRTITSYNQGGQTGCVWASSLESLRLWGQNCPANGDYRSWYKEYPTCSPGD